MRGGGDDKRYYDVEEGKDEKKRNNNNYYKIKYGNFIGVVLELLSRSFSIDCRYLHTHT